MSNKAIGALFDERRSRGESRDDLEEKDRESRQSMDAVRVAHARKRNLRPSIAADHSTGASSIDAGNPTRANGMTSTASA